MRRTTTTEPSDLLLAERRMLQSVVEAARQIFGAAASSVFLVDPESGELVFEAVSGEGERHLLGTSFPAGTGIAGWVVASGQTMEVADIENASVFSRQAAESTGYVPRSIMAAPLIGHGRCIGVLEVLDAAASVHGTLDGTDLLSVFAAQASCGLELLLRLRLTERQRPPAVDIGALAAAIGERVRERGDLPADHPAARLLALVEDILDADRW